MKDLEGKTAFITGGGSGVGLGQAKVLAEEEKMNVVIADIRQDHLDQAMEYFKSKKDVSVHAVRLDVTDREAFQEARKESEKFFRQPVQVLFNTCGVSQFGELTKATYDDWDWQLDVNIKGVINGVHTFLPEMIEYGKGGHILNTASMSSFVALEGCAIYTTSKFAIRGYSESLRLELEKYNIGVSILCPGGVNTNIHESVMSRQGKYANTGYYDSKADPAVFENLKKAVENGFDPVDLGRIVRNAVKRGDFWILPYPEFIPLIEKRNKEIIDALGFYKDDPDYKRRMETGLDGPIQKMK
ncbi:MAG: SDR family NAD(P)-dependent oxidoreductase [Spirochaetes bacterium]|nr:SDR family NAD(P)-dependent oxidoreductase [Spirochaetota bacterium]